MPAEVEFARIPHPNPASDAERAAKMTDPVFGAVRTDHMVTISYTEGQGWHDAQLTARGPLPLDPASAVFHYAQEIFEGMKAYRGEDGSVKLFRPEKNAQRFQISARRLAMPELPEDLFLQAVEALVKADEAWVPQDGSLYLRPFLIATEGALGVRPSKEYMFVVIACPVGNYFKGEARAVSIWASRDYSRAARGGTGFAKCGGNYAASLAAQAEAYANGCDQVLFVDAIEGRWIEELGGMNVFFVKKDGSLITPPLGGTILPGVTRDSLIQLAKDQGRTVQEELYSLEQLRADAEAGEVVEAFACGTAAIVVGIGKIKTPSGEFTIGDGNEGYFARSIRAELLAIQKGQGEDRHNWVRSI